MADVEPGGRPATQAWRERFPRPLFPAPTQRLGTQAAGLILGLGLWAWVIMPLITGGPSKVNAMLRAKFLNQTPDGTWLP